VCAKVNVGLFPKQTHMHTVRQSTYTVRIQLQSLQGSLRLAMPSTRLRFITWGLLQRAAGIRAQVGIYVIVIRHVNSLSGTVHEARCAILHHRSHEVVAHEVDTSFAGWWRRHNTRSAQSTSMCATTSLAFGPLNE
jgi:hypothetical protein